MREMTGMRQHDALGAGDPCLNRAHVTVDIGDVGLAGNKQGRHLDRYRLNIRMSLVACQAPLASRATGRIATTSEEAL
jgi:hypothetical protein